MEKILFLTLFGLSYGLVVSKTVVSSGYEVRSNRQDSCWELLSRGRRLPQDVIIRTVSVSSLPQCQRECQDVLFNCETISFGFDRFGNATCDLSDWDAGSLSVKTKGSFLNDDFQDTSGYVVYSRFGRDPDQRCSVSTDASVIIDSSNNSPRPVKTYTRPSFQDDKDFPNPLGSSEVCYTLVTANRRLAPRYVERSVSVYGLDECKILCTRETTFDCRSFSFRRRSSSLNCDLSREDSASLDLSSPYVLANDPDFDYYQKTSRGSICYQQYNSKPVYGTQGSGYSNSYPSLYPVVSGASSPGLYQGQSFPSSDPGCYRRLKSGYRLDSRVVRLSIVARSQSDCELECNRSRGFACRSFSFKFPTYLSSGYGSPYTNSRDFNNCDLSDLEPRNIDPVRHLILDRNADIYERIQDWRDCREKTDGSSLVSSSALANKPPLTSQCFQRLFRGGLRMERRIIRFTVSVKSPRECEQECLNAKFFTCRGFSYRYSQSAVIPDAYHKDYDNCDLTDIDLNLVDPTRDFIDDGNYDTWRKAGTGRECDFLSNSLPDTTGSGSGLNQGSVDPWSRPSQLDQFAGQDQLVGCYARYRGGYRLDTRIVRDSTNVRTLAECEVECSKARFNCLMFSFRFSNRNGDYGQNPNNCELSNLSTLELDRYRDMIEDRDYETFSRVQNNRNCNFRISDKAYAVDSLTSSSGLGLNSVGVSSSDITVSGLHCRAGTWCRPNQNSDYWFCETDSNGNWDYCCKPTHPCGYTEGFSYPWCFVGTDEDANRLHGSKWRPCSERYAERPYAYLHRESPPNNTSLPEILQTIHRFASNSSSLSRSSVSVSLNTEESESVTASPGANERQPPTL